MQRHIVWKGLESDTVESCIVSRHADKICVYSEITGSVDGKMLHAEYYIRLGEHWEVEEFGLSAKTGDTISRFAMRRQPQGKWFDASGPELKEFDGCRYIDISITPFTNSLPVNGLNLQKGSEKEIKVLYLDVMKGKTYTDIQNYQKIKSRLYRFSNDSGNFEADIEVDKQGFVLHYPKLYKLS